MSCPDVGHIVDFVAGRSIAPELVEHIAACPACQADIALQRSVAQALKPDQIVPDDLMERTLQRMDFEPAESPRAPKIPVLQLALGSILGSVTVGVAVITSDASMVTDPREFVLFLIASGLVVCVGQMRASLNDGDRARP